jgi:hypothetical protein
MKALALHHAPLLEPPSRFRLAAAVLVLGAAVAGAASLYSHKFEALDCYPPVIRCSHGDELVVVKPGWVGPTALALCLFGVAAAVGLLWARLRLAIALVVLGASLAVAAVVYYSDPGAELFTQRCRPNVAAFCGVRYGYPGGPGRAGWIGPTALGISLLGVVLAAGVLLSARRRPPE